MIFRMFLIGIIFNKCIATGIGEQQTDAENGSEQRLLSKYSWRPVGFVYQPGALGLHAEIEQFYEYMQLTPIERALRTRVIDRIASLVHQVWPNADVKLIGSNVLGLALPNSDIDLMIVNASGHSPIHELSAKLVTSEIAEPNSIEVRANLRIPIIEFTDNESKINIDMPFTDEATLKKAAQIKEYQRKFPVLSKLVLVLKQYLKHRGVNDVFTGGISSHPLTLMSINFLQMHPTYKGDQEGADPNLGELLLDFFELYGKKFDYENYGLTIKNGGKYLPRTQLPCDIFNGHYQLFCIEDPLVWVNACDDAYRASAVKEAFNDAYNILSSAISNNRNRTNTGCAEDDTILGRIIHITDDLIIFRKWVQLNFKRLLKEN